MPESEIAELRQQLRDIVTEMRAMTSRQITLEKLQQETTELLRGRGDSMGMVGQVQVLWRSWVVVVGFGGMAAGYILKSFVG